MAREEDPNVPKPPQQRGVARVSAARDVTSRIYLSGKDAGPVFVDDTGKRRRLLTWLSLVFAVLALALVAALWVSQAASTSG